MASDSASQSSFGSGVDSQASSNRFQPRGVNEEEDEIDEVSILAGVHGVLYTVSKEKAPRLWFVVFRLVLDVLQLLLLVIDPSYGFNIDPDNKAWQIFSFIGLNKFFSDRGYTFFLVCLYIMAAALALNLGLCVWVQQSFAANRFDHVWPIMWLKVFSLVFYQVLDVASLTLFLLPMQCNYWSVPDDQRFYNANFPEVYCWTMPHIVHVAVASVSLVVFSCLAALFTMAEVELSPVSRNLMAMSHTEVETISFGIKTAMTCANVFLTNRQWMSIAQLLLTAWLLYLYVMYVPHLSDGVNYARCGSYAAVFYAAILLVCSSFNTSGSDQDQTKRADAISTALWAGLAPAALLGAGAAWLRLRYFTHVVAIRFRDAEPGIKPKYIYNFTDAREVEITARCCRRWVPGDEDAVEEDAAALAQTILHAGRTLLPTSPYMIILYSSFLIDVQGSYQSGYSELQAAKKAPNPGFLERFCIFVREQEHTQKATAASSGDNAEASLMSYVEYMRNYRLVLRMHIEALLAKRSFWEALLHSQITFDRLSKAVARIESSVKSAERVYRQVLARHSSSVKIVQMYIKFLQTVKNDPWSASRWQAECEKLQKAEEEANERAVLGGAGVGGDAATSNHDDSKGVIIMGANCLIKMVNDTAVRALGYDSKNAMIGKNINIIVPPPFAKNHNTYVRNYLNSGQATVLGYVREFVALHRDRYVVPIQVYVIKVSGIGEDSVFMGLFSGLPSKPNTAMCWVMQSGGVLSCDGAFTDTFGYQQNDVHARPVSELVMDPQPLEDLLAAIRREVVLAQMISAAAPQHSGGAHSRRSSALIQPNDPNLQAVQQQNKQQESAKGSAQSLPAVQTRPSTQTSGQLPMLASPNATRGPPMLQGMSRAGSTAVSGLPDASNNPNASVNGNGLSAEKLRAGLKSLQQQQSSLGNGWMPVADSNRDSGRPGSLLNSGVLSSGPLNSGTLGSNLNLTSTVAPAAAAAESASSGPAAVAEGVLVSGPGPVAEAAVHHDSKGAPPKAVTPAAGRLWRIPGVLWKHMYSEERLMTDVEIKVGGIGHTALFVMSIKCMDTDRRLMLVCDSRGRITHATAALAETLGTTVSKLQAGRTMYALDALLPPPFIKLHHAWLRKLSTPGPTFGAAETEIIPPWSCRSGLTVCLPTAHRGVASGPPEPKPFKLSFSRKQLQPVGGQGNAESLTVVKLEPLTLEEALDERRLKLVVDSEGLVTWASGSPSDLFGFEPQALVGCSIAYVIDILRPAPKSSQDGTATLPTTPDELFAGEAAAAKMLLELAERSQKFTGMSWRVGVRPIIDPVQLLSLPSAVAASMLEQRTRPAVMSVGYRLEAPAMDGARVVLAEKLQLDVELWRSDLLCGVLEVDSNCTVVGTGVRDQPPQWYAPGLLLGVPSHMMTGTPLAAYFPGIMASAAAAKSSRPVDMLFTEGGLSGSPGVAANNMPNLKDNPLLAAIMGANGNVNGPNFGVLPGQVAPGNKGGLKSGGAGGRSRNGVGPQHTVHLRHQADGDELELQVQAVTKTNTGVTGGVYVIIHMPHPKCGRHDMHDYLAKSPAMLLMHPARHHMSDAWRTAVDGATGGGRSSYSGKARNRNSIELSPGAQPPAAGDSSLRQQLSGGADMYGEPHPPPHPRSHLPGQTPSALNQAAAERALQRKGSRKGVKFGDDEGAAGDGKSTGLDPSDPEEGAASLGLNHVQASPRLDKSPRREKVSPRAARDGPEYSGDGTGRPAANGAQQNSGSGGDHDRITKWLAQAPTPDPIAMAEVEAEEGSDLGSGRLGEGDEDEEMMDDDPPGNMGPFGSPFGVPEYAQQRPGMGMANGYGEQQQQQQRTSQTGGDPDGDNNTDLDDLDEAGGVGRADGGANDYKRGKRFKKLAKLLGGEKIVGAVRRLRIFAYGTLCMLVCVDLAAFLAYFVLISEQIQKISDLENAGRAAAAVMRISVAVSSLDVLFDGLAPAGVRHLSDPAGDVTLHLDRLRTAVDDFEYLHRGTYKGFDGSKSLPVDFGVRSLWEEPLTNVTLYFNDNSSSATWPVPMAVPRMMSLWDLGNLYLASARTLMQNALALNASGAPFARLTDVMFVMHNGPHVIVPAYRSTLDGLLQTTIQDSSDMNSIQLIILGIEGIAISCVSIALVTIAARQVAARRHAIYSCFCAVPQGLVRTLAMKPLDVGTEEEGEEAEGEDGGDGEHGNGQSHQDEEGNAEDGEGGGHHAGGSFQKVNLLNLAAASRTTRQGKHPHSRPHGFFPTLLWLLTACGRLGGKVAPANTVGAGGKRELLASHNDTFWLVAPFVGWGAFIIAINLVGHQLLKNEGSTLAAMDAVSSLAVRAYTTNFAAQVYCREPSSNVTATKVSYHNDLITQSALLLLEYDVLLRGSQAATSNITAFVDALAISDTDTRSSLSSALLHARLLGTDGLPHSAFSLLYTFKGCLAARSDECQNATSTYYQSTSNGLDQLMKAYMLQDESLTRAEPFTSVTLSHPNFKYVYEVGNADVVDGLATLADVYLNAVRKVYNGTLALHITAFALSFVMGALFLLFILRPFLARATTESRRIAELLSSLPPELDTLQLVKAAIAAVDANNADPLSPRGQSATALSASTKFASVKVG